MLGFLRKFCGDGATDTCGTRGGSPNSRLRFLAAFQLCALHRAAADTDFLRRFEDALATGERGADCGFGLRVDAGAADRLTASGSLRPGAGDPGMDAFGDNRALEFEDAELNRRASGRD